MYLFQVEVFSCKIVIKTHFPFSTTSPHTHIQCPKFLVSSYPHVFGSSPTPNPPTSCLFRLYYSYLNDRLHLPVLGGVSSSSSFTTMMRPTAKERRVRFQQETKSQSLDTPYHHTHEQQKLDMDMDSDTMAERSNSFTAISQCYTSDKGKENLKFYLLP